MEDCDLIPIDNIIITPFFGDKGKILYFQLEKIVRGRKIYPRNPEFRKFLKEFRERKKRKTSHTQCHQ